ncbi:MAG: rhodanese-like domain-containing protein [Tenericutes bacterium]|jgi:phage shock protein E|nr:rhodanese-like domain-containing protein [Mycoplasmatota bacterium]
MSILDLFKKTKNERRLDPKIYKKMLEDQVPLFLIDVRTQSEFDQAHIPNAILFPVYLVENQIETYFPDKEITYVLYCRSGIRSHHALLMMNQLGYERVYDMGGIIDWPYETIEKE